MAIASSLQQFSASISHLFLSLATRLRDRDALQALTEEDRQRLADEIGLTTVQLDGLVAAGPEASLEIENMMTSLGIDSSKVNSAFWKLMGELRVTCALCGAKKDCRRALSDGTAAARMDDFCPNAAELSELAARKDVAVA